MMPEQGETLEQIQLQYLEEWQAGRPPTLEEYVRRYPQFARELADFVLSVAELEATAARTVEGPELSPEARRGRDRAIREIRDMVSRQWEKTLSTTIDGGQGSGAAGGRESASRTPLRLEDLKPGISV